MGKLIITNKKHLFHFLIVIVFVLYISSANYLFNRVLIVKGESKLVEEPGIEASQKIKLYIDKAQDVKREWKDLIEIEGWGYIQGLPANKDDEIFLVLTSGSNNYTFKTKSIYRPDVTEAFKDLKVNLNYAGFSVLISNNLIKDGEYNVGLFIKNKTHEELSYGLNTLVKKNGSVKIK